jgi:hypothetical protein
VTIALLESDRRDLSGADERNGDFAMVRVALSWLPPVLPLAD